MQTLFFLLFALTSASSFAADAISSYPDTPPPGPVIKGTPYKTPTDLSKPAEIGLHLTVMEIAPHLFLITHTFPYPANAVLVEMANQELVLVDTTFFSDSMYDLHSWIKKKFGTRKITAINTHFHVDRIGGNAYLIKNGIPVYGSNQIAPLIKERGKAMREVMVELAVTDPMKRLFKNLVFTPPNHPFALKDGKILKFGNEEVQIKFLGPGHTADNVVVYFPGQQLLAAGCLVIAGKTVGNPQDANLVEWPKTVKALSELKAKFVIAGRGLETGPQLIPHTLEVLERNKNPVISKYKHRKIVISPL